MCIKDLTPSAMAPVKPKGPLLPPDFEAKNALFFHLLRGDPSATLVQSLDKVQVRYILERALFETYADPNSLRLINRILESIPSSLVMPQLLGLFKAYAFKWNPRVILHSQPNKDNARQMISSMIRYAKTHLDDLPLPEQQAQMKALITQYIGIMKTDLFKTYNMRP
jgi:hypothetical protein